MSDSSRVMHALRAMAWARARGEIESMMVTYYSDEDGDKFEKLHNLVDEFFTAVEDEGLAE